MMKKAARKAKKKTTAKKADKPASVSVQLEGFIANFDAKVGRLIRAVRSALRRRFPSAHELVYDNYNFFVIGYCSTERPSDAFLSIVASAKGVGICFIHGASLPDPDGILLGSGKQTRFIHIEKAAMLKRPEVNALLLVAAAQSRAPLRA